MYRSYVIIKVIIKYNLQGRFINVYIYKYYIVRKKKLLFGEETFYFIIYIILQHKKVKNVYYYCFLDGFNKL